MNRQQLGALLGPVGLLLVLVVIFAGGPASPGHDFFFGFATGLLVVAAVALLWGFSRSR